MSLDIIEMKRSCSTSGGCSRPLVVESVQVTLLDPIVLKSIIQRELDFECPLCLTEIDKIHYCASCRTVSCEKCIYKWSAHSSHCPYCSKRWKSVSPELMLDLYSARTFIMSMMTQKTPDKIKEVVDEEKKLS